MNSCVYIAFYVISCVFALGLFWTETMTLTTYKAQIVNVVNVEITPPLRVVQSKASDTEISMSDEKEEIIEIMEEIPVPGIATFPDYELLQGPDDTIEDPVLMILEMIIVPRHGYIHTSILRKEAVQKPHYEVNASWSHPTYKPSQFIAETCDVIPTMEIEILGKRYKSRPCEKLNVLDANLGSRVTHTKHIFADGYGPEKGPLSFLMIHPEPNVKVWIDKNRYVLIDLQTRSAGIMKQTTRLPIDHSNRSEYYNPTETPGTMSICTKGMNKYSPYLKYITTYMRKIGISHYYLGFTGTKQDLEKIKKLLAEEIESNFLTILTVDLDYLRFIGASTLFVMSCYTHARQMDMFVGNFDTDELPVLYDELFYDGNNGVTSTIGEYIMEKFTDDTKMFASSKAYRDTGPDWNSTAYYEGAILTSRPQKIWRYSYIIAQARYMTMMHYRNDNPMPEKTYSLHVDYPAMSVPSVHNALSYIKVIAISAATNTLEVHHVSGIDMIERHGIQLASPIEGYAPPETVLLADRELFNTAHFAAMHGTRDPMCYINSRSCFLMPNATGFKAIMGDYSLDSKWIHL